MSRQPLVVLCEGQADCRFYRTVAAHLRAGTPQLLAASFIAVGGKYAFHDAIRMRRGSGETMRAVAGFGLLGTETPLREVVDALGGVEHRCEPLWREVHRALRAPVQTPAPMLHVAFPRSVAPTE